MYNFKKHKRKVASTLIATLIMSNIVPALPAYAYYTDYVDPISVSARASYIDAGIKDFTTFPEYRPDDVSLENGKYMWNVSSIATSSIATPSKATPSEVEEEVIEDEVLEELPDVATSSEANKSEEDEVIIEDDMVFPGLDDITKNEHDVPGTEDNKASTDESKDTTSDNGSNESTLEKETEAGTDETKPDTDTSDTGSDQKETQADTETETEAERETITDPIVSETEESKVNTEESADQTETSGQTNASDKENASSTFTQTESKNVSTEDGSGTDQTTDIEKAETSDHSNTDPNADTDTAASLPSQSSGSKVDVPAVSDNAEDKEETNTGDGYIINEIGVPEAEAGVEINETNFPSVVVLADAQALDADGNGILDPSECPEWYTPSGKVDNWTGAENISTKLWIKDNVNVYCTNGTFTDIKVSNDDITKFNIKNNKTVKKLELTGCPNLTELIAVGCDSLTIVNAADCSKLSTHDFGYTTNLDSVDLSGTAITKFTYYAKNVGGGIGVSHLNLSNCKQLTEIGIKSGVGWGLSDLNLEGCDALTAINLNGNKLTELNLSNLSSLKTVNLNNNQLTENSLNLNGCTAIETLQLNNNAFTNFDITSFPKLKTLYMQNNQLTEMIFGRNQSIERFYLDNNKLTRIDAPGLSSLTGFNIRNNPLEYIDFSESGLGTCSISGFTALTEVDLHDSKNLKSISITGMKALTKIDLSGCEILNNITGYNNALTEIDLTGITTLKEIYIYQNKLTSLDLSNNAGITYIDCSTNQLTELDVSKFPVLSQLKCSSNGLTTLDLSQNPELTKVYANSNKLTEIDLNSNPKLTNFEFGRNQLTRLYAPGLTQLKQYNIGSNPLKYINLSEAPLTSFGYTDNKILEEVILSDCTKLKTVNIYRNSNLSKVNLSGCDALTKVSCYSDTSLTDMSWVADIPNLQHLTASMCGYESIDVSNNLELKELYIKQNNIQDIDVSSNDKLQIIDVSGNQIERLDLSNNMELTKILLTQGSLNWIAFPVNPDYNISSIIDELSGTWLYEDTDEIVKNTAQTIYAEGQVIYKIEGEKKSIPFAFTTYNDGPINVLNDARIDISLKTADGADVSYSVYRLNSVDDLNADNAYNYIPEKGNYDANLGVINGSIEAIHNERLDSGEEGQTYAYILVFEPVPKQTYFVDISANGYAKQAMNDANNLAGFFTGYGFTKETRPDALEKYPVELAEENFPNPYIYEIALGLDKDGDGYLSSEEKMDEFVPQEEIVNWRGADYLSDTLVLDNAMNTSIDDTYFSEIRITADDLTNLSIDNNKTAKLYASNLPNLENVNFNRSKFSYINLSNTGITNFKYSERNTLKDLNLSETKISKLDLYNMNLSTLKASDCENLENVILTGNTNIKEVDFSGCSKLTTVDKWYDSIINLNLARTGFSTLSFIYLNINNLNLEGNTALTSLVIRNTHALKTLNLKGCTGLTSFFIGDWMKDDIDLDLSDCINLTSLSFYYNTGIKVIDISNNDLITSLDVRRTSAIQEIYFNHNEKINIISILKTIGGTWKYADTDEDVDLNIKTLAADGQHVYKVVEETTP